LTEYFGWAIICVIISMWYSSDADRNEIKELLGHRHPANPAVKGMLFIIFWLAFAVLIILHYMVVHHD